MLRQEMFLMKVLCLIPGVQNLCSDCKCDLFCDVMWPVLLTSNDVTLVVMCVMSVVKCAYLLVLSVCLCSILLSRGTVSSNMSRVFFSLSQIVMSGFRFVTQTSGGTVPPPGASCPSMSLNTVNFEVSKQFTT